MSLQNNSAIVLFGATLPDKATISRDLEDLNISMLRQEPSQVNMACHPYIKQARYELYKTNLPAFMYAAIEKESRSILDIYHPVNLDSVQPIPFSLPKITFGIDGRMTEDMKKTIHDMLGETALTEMTRGGRPTFSFDPRSYEEVEFIQGLTQSISTTPAFVGSANIKGAAVGRGVARIITALLRLHRYPAFKVEDHVDEYIKFHGEEGEDGMGREEEAAIDADETDTMITAAKNLERARELWEKGVYSREIVKFSNTSGSFISAQTLSETAHISDPLAELQRDDGLYAPFIAPLQHYDTQLVPRFIKDYLFGILGEDEDECSDLFATLKSGWGVYGNTESGKEMTHVVLCLKLALEGQAQVIPVFHPTGGYQGSFIMGAGFVVTVEGRTRTPVDAQTLQNAYGLTNVHERALQTIGVETGIAGWIIEHRDEITSMMALRTLLLGTNLAPLKHESIIRAAKMLNFSHPHWKVNAVQVHYALTLLTTAGPLPNDLPIHPSYLLSTDRTAVVWSCFGAFAPSFKVPSGRIVPLSTLKAQVKVTEKGETRMEEKVATRLAVRTLPLKTAIDDLEWVKTEKKIQTPFFQASEKASGEHFTRFFAGDGMLKVVTELRRFCDTVVDVGDSKGKKRAGGDEGKDSSKRRKGALFG